MDDDSKRQALVDRLRQRSEEVRRLGEEHAQREEAKRIEAARMAAEIREKEEEIDARAEAAGPTTSRSLRVEGKHTTRLELRSSEDGRIRVPNEQGFDRQAKKDLVTCGVAEKLRVLSRLPNSGAASEALPLAFESAVEEYRPNHLEFLLMSNAFMQTAVSQNLALRAMGREDARAAARDAELSQRSGAEARRSVQLMHAMRSPSVRVGRADQLNVAHGPQQVNNHEGATDVRAVEADAEEDGDA